MFPLTALLTHAELSKKKFKTESLEARRAPRRTRYGNLTLFPIVERAEPTFEESAEIDEPRIGASISNVSETGVGLILSENLPSGLEFNCQWPVGEYAIPLRFEVVHSQPISAGMYRTGARLVAGVMPEEQVPSEFVRREEPKAIDYELTLTTPMQPTVIAAAAQEIAPTESPLNHAMQLTESAPVVFSGGVLQFEPYKPERSMSISPAPVGTFRASHAFGFDKTECINGVTTCGWDRAVQIRRDGDRLWLYIHTPGKKNGWGIFVDPEVFESALQRVQDAADSPFISTLAA